MLKLMCLFVLFSTIASAPTFSLIQKKMDLISGLFNKSPPQQLLGPPMMYGPPPPPPPPVYYAEPVYGPPPPPIVHDEAVFVPSSGPAPAPAPIEMKFIPRGVEIVKRIQFT
ncbi:protein tonB2-like isoform X2 [Wyeomyia smithii]|uniref:protein tonB2-like isoform X2 n=1 Tax=Wyeomyia smithii TaxID=174621 RepID=UPI002467EB18|nr:protein tonB2-like isoform X2 [Wyeomyia smithii]